MIYCFLKLDTLSGGGGGGTDIDYIRSFAAGLNIQQLWINVALDLICSHSFIVLCNYLFIYLFITCTVCITSFLEKLFFFTQIDHRLNCFLKGKRIS